MGHVRRALVVVLLKSADEWAIFSLFRLRVIECACLPFGNGAVLATLFH